MKNLGAMMKQAQKMQEKMAELQSELENLEVDGVAGGGMVKVTLNGKGYARKITIDPSMIGPDDTEVLEDLLVAAINDAKTKAEERAKEKMSEITGGLQLPPGMSLPF
jgi:DNA-binding YbaB/EbfC family protein